jgi:hypothetical protein
MVGLMFAHASVNAHMPRQAALMRPQNCGLDGTSLIMLLFCSRLAPLWQLLRHRQRTT